MKMTKGFGKMLVARRSMFSGKTATIDLPILEKQMNAWMSGTLIQKAFPNLSPDEREFLMTGALPGEWEDVFGEDE